MYTADELADAMKPVTKWLASGEGKARIQKTLLGEGLRLDPQDLAQETTLRALQHIKQGKPIQNLPGLLTVMMRRATIDMLRGRAWGSRNELLGLSGPPEDDQHGAWEPAANDPDIIEMIAAADDRDRLRRQLHRQLAGAEPFPSPQTVGAALALVILNAEDPVPTRQYPQPGPGAAPEDGPMWAALWFGGHRDCFPDGAPEASSATLRQRRSRAGAKVRELLVKAAQAISLTGHATDERATRGRRGGNRV